MRRGFTLIEVLVAVLILAFSVVSAFGAQSNAVATRNYIEDISVAIQLARCRMNEIETLVREEGGFQELDIEEEGECCEISERTDFSCRWKIERIELPEMTSGAELESNEMVNQAVGLAFGQKAADRLEMIGGLGSFTSAFMPMLNNVLVQGIRRVTVTVLWERIPRTREYTLYQYMVHPSQGGMTLIKAAAAMNQTEEAAEQ